MKILENVNLEPFNSYRIKSRAKIVYLPESIDDVKSFLRLHQSYILIGGGNNIIFSKPCYDDPFFILSNNVSNITDQSNCISVETGVSLNELSIYCQENSIAGYDRFVDIPGTVGGAIYMNAGTGQSSFGDNVISVEVFHKSSKTFKVLYQEECDFSYRSSVFSKSNDFIILSARLTKKEGSRKEIELLHINSINQRWEKQPRDFPNAGSVFKRPNGYYVGTMIEAIGLKGYSIGGAQISEKHAGFIVNKGGATGEDIIALIMFVKNRVLLEFGVELECEQIIL